MKYRSVNDPALADFELSSRESILGILCGKILANYTTRNKGN